MINPFRVLSAAVFSLLIPAARAQAPVTCRQLPLGDIRPAGWLNEMLVRQRDGLTGHLDVHYPLVMNERNGWLGGDGDQWERGPYWIDGLVPLAYMLHDEKLIAKAKPWVEWALNSQQPDGYFGPATDYPQEEGLQRDNSRDWWPKMVMLKVLQQYYSATKDQRVITLMTNYFRYQLKELPQTPLGHWTYWARFRGGDNLMMVYWLYDITKAPFLLQLGELLHRQTFDYTGSFLHTGLLAQTGSIHCVNLAQGFKEPAVYYRHHPDKMYLNALKKGLADLDKYNGMAHGLYGGDEALHGNNPTQGSEFCSAVEMMFSLETALEITGDVDFADRLEKIAFNALPAQATDDFMARQYFQQANQVMATRQVRNFADNHGGTDVCYGVLSGYPCCTSNMHQGWPKFAQNLWYTTGDRGVAALVYAPSEAKVRVGGREMVWKEETNYPFDESVRFSLESGVPGPALNFPFYLRVPAWCKEATILINGKVWEKSEGGKVVALRRGWKNGDRVELQLPMHIFNRRWQENALSVERGPLTFALKIGEQETRVANSKDPVAYGSSFIEVRPATDWNYGLYHVPEARISENYSVAQQKDVAAYPWNLQNAPVIIRTKARKIPSWKLYNETAGPIPYSTIYNMETAAEEEDIELVPYGCTQLRISQFPVIGGK
ncbi:beta-L-arabinofuranosidase domain-containing protein [Dyadobacter sandarakinus]|uniref:Glycoside hydrolase family 127 protein n=1 Tax=Dyadobacter sandarakinus TaxID=2747268 RepID=A0ABX7I283_9BACT|nr:beta-L-arabinofuranosidase domain-containing protein [Dyadobacter sandarakinus]QRQ99889.1 glycoside hydrolase family 127 protein [Dyadobacter sandarakinus]